MDFWEEIDISVGQLFGQLESIFQEKRKTNPEVEIPNFVCCEHKGIGSSQLGEESELLGLVVEDLHFPLPKSGIFYPQMATDPGSFSPCLRMEA